MISVAEVGHFALILAVGVALYQFIVPLVGAQRGDVAAMRACGILERDLDASVVFVPLARGGSGIAVVCRDCRVGAAVVEYAVKRSDASDRVIPVGILRGRSDGVAGGDEPDRLIYSKS